MTRDDILRMARKAGNVQCGCCLPYYDDMEEAEMGDFCVRFAALVAAAERDALLEVLQNLDANPELTSAWLQARAAIAKAEENT